MTISAAAKPATETKNLEPMGIMKPRRVSKEMETFLCGASEIPPTQAGKEIWAYIKQHNLQATTGTLPSSTVMCLNNFIGNSSCVPPLVSSGSTEAPPFAIFLSTSCSRALVINPDSCSKDKASRLLGQSREKNPSPELDTGIHFAESQERGFRYAASCCNLGANPANKKVIICDEKLKKIFGGRECVGFLEIAGLINPHFLM
ncbi:hypothetical protein OROGR_010009 [Orobanche gracilis]